MDVSKFEKQEKEFLEISNEIMKEAEKRNSTIRLLGALAFRTHCPKFKYMEYSTGRFLSDIDFAGYGKDVNKIEKLYADLKWKEIAAYRIYTGVSMRRIFTHPTDPKIYSEVFFDKLRMCHDISFIGRLEIDYPTISLVDLLLEKMQIVRLEEKDIIDTITLLREHNVGDHDKETINIEYLSSLCAQDWGLWKTITMNLEKVKNALPNYGILKEDDKEDVRTKIDSILDAIQKKPKSMRWKMRASIGEKQKWYREVEERHLV